MSSEKQQKDQSVSEPEEQDDGAPLFVLDTVGASEEDIVNVEDSEPIDEEQSDRDDNDNSDGNGDEQGPAKKKGPMVLEAAKGRNIRKTKIDSDRELAKIIPGYTAPRHLNASSLDKFRPSGGISELQRRAEKQDASTRGFVFDGGSKAKGSYSYSQAVSSFKHGKKKAADTSAGAGWFHMQATPMTESLKTDLAILRNRAYLDPKRFYKRSEIDKNSNMVQVGTVIEGAAEFYSSRLTKAQRKSTFADELLAEGTDSAYVMNKYKQMERENMRKAAQRKGKSGKRKRR